MGKSYRRRAILGEALGLLIRRAGEAATVTLLQTIVTACMVVIRTQRPLESDYELTQMAVDFKKMKLKRNTELTRNGEGFGSENNAEIRNEGDQKVQEERDELQTQVLLTACKCRSVYRLCLLPYNRA
jgi:hypothetical protein